MDKVLVTGASGFLGGHLVRHLRVSGYCILAYYRSEASKEILINKVNYLYSIDDLDRPFDDFSIYAVIHLATNYGREKNSCEDLIETNIGLPLKLARLATLGGCKLFINTDTFFTKMDSYSYLSDYTSTKKLAWEYIKSLYPDRRETIFCNMVLFHVFGENDSQSKFIPWLISELMKDSMSPIPLTSCTQTRDFIYVDDVVHAYEQVLKSYSSHRDFQTFEVGSGSSVCLKDFVCEIKDSLNSKGFRTRELAFGLIPQREGEIDNFVANTKDLRNIGWVKRWTWKDAIENLIASHPSK
ncbi:NAD(P)-dependent oxidoreductase [Marinoscillum sp. 108]|uniref:NAD-dependent epimerase/dehydratase family protein n=1 Tax=Marinoscillum sp. 108 TaxID=2653151 RepID=UPI0012F251DD|nr:NAD-dependent epimerase/dehydratase family protein [Marinoscillum sp. 108]VXD19086.1 putative CDP-abequose synthase [Marinoscillum sp. 108]